MQVLDAVMDDARVKIAQTCGMSWERVRVTVSNYQTLPARHARTHTLLGNIATSIDSHDVMAWAQARGVYYLDTCIDPWTCQDGALDSSSNANHQMRERVLALGRKVQSQAGPHPTAPVAHGANPGLVSILAKEGLMLMARQFLEDCAQPQEARDWAALAQQLGIRVIQISERDSQYSSRPRAAHEFVNTWSVEGFVAEALQPIELGWGSHEAAGPYAQQACHHDDEAAAGVYFKQLGVRTQVRSWAPAWGAFTG